MPTFVVGSGVGDNYATFILTFPDVIWFKSAIMGALFELTTPNNWIERGDVAVSFAVEESAQMIASIKVSAFNPFPVGMIFPYSKDVAPEGYLPCDGGSYAVADYPELFAVIDYNFGGSGANFNVPSLFNRGVVGSGADFAYMDVGGAETVTLTTAEMPSHNHSAANPTIIDPSHSHVVTSVVPTLITIGAGVPAPSAIPSVGSTAPALTGISALAGAIGNTGGDGAHENMPPFMALPYIIYVGR
jgi:microcystin-dependent protein